MPKIFDILVIGGGVMGASIFHHLSKANYKVALLEKNKVVSGCTALSGGIVRCFHLNTSLSDKAMYGWHYYQNFEIHTAIPCEFNRSGFIYFPKEEDIEFSKKEVKRLSSSFPIEWLNTEDVHTKFGHLLKGKTVGAVYEPLSGYMNPTKVSKAWITSGESLGGKVYEHTRVTHLHRIEDNFVHVGTTNGDFFAEKIILALGPYTPNFLNQMNIQHNLYTQVIHVDIRKPNKITPQPAFIDDVFDLNGRADANGTHYLGHPTHLKIMCPSECLNIDLDHSKKIEITGSKRWKWVEESELVQTLRTPDCYMQDGSGFVKKIENYDSIYVATGFSGGGFKVAPWVGHEIQRLIQNN